MDRKKNPHTMQRREGMTLGNLYVAGIIADNTRVIVRNSRFGVLAAGEWFTDRVAEYMERELESFTWQDDGKLYADIKEA